VAVYASPLERAYRTARLAGFAEPIPEPLLMEWDYGEYEGITTTEIHARRPDWDLWRDGCPGGESIGQVRNRAERFLERAQAAGTGPVIAFSHGHLLRVLALVFLDLPDSAGARLSLETASLSVLRSGQRGRLLQLWNDIGHLPGLPA
jgi:broad specificity phosphatase PhoE